MADVDHPKTHVEDQDIDLPRKQPESPKREGIDPLTESDTMYPAEDVKGNAARFNKREEKEAVEARADDGQTDSEAKVAEDVAAQEDLGNDNAEVQSDKTDVETGTENTSESNKTVDAPKGKTSGSKTSSR